MKKGNNKTLDKYKNLAFIIKFYCFQEELKNTINKTKNKSYIVYLLKKSTMVVYKQLFDYTELCDILQKKEDILKDIKDKEGIHYDKLSDSILSKIIETLPKDYLTIIDKINKKLNTIEKEDKNHKFINNYIEFQNVDNNKIVRLKIFQDFDLIDSNIDSLDMKLKIEKSLGECFILPEKKLLLYYKNNDFLYEIVNVDQNLNMQIEYLLNKKETCDSKKFANYLFKNGTNNLVNINSDISYIIMNDNKTKDKIYLYKFNNQMVKKMNKEKIVDEEPIKQKKSVKNQEDKKNQVNKKKKLSK